MTRPLRAIIVEDSENDAQLMVHALRKGGFEISFRRVDTPASLRTALAEEKWDIILSDHSMPHFSAPEALNILKEGGFTLPFIIISGSISTELAVSLMRTGAHDWINKDDLSRLVPAVERELQEAMILRKQKEITAVSEEKFRTLANTTTDWVYWMDPERNPIFISQSVFQITGYRREEFLSDPDLSMRIIHPDDRDILRKHEMEYTTPPMLEHSSEIEFRILHKDGDVRWISHSCGPIVDQNNQSLGRHVSNRDITRRKVAELELKKKTAETIESGQKAEAYFDFLAHDIANILSPVMAYADILRSKPNDPAEVIKFSSRILEQVQRASSLISNLRRLESIEKTHPNEIDTIDLRTLLSALEDTIRSDFPNAEIAISYDIPDVESMNAKGGEWVENVLRCIYDNAVRYSTGSAVKLEIRASTLQLEGKGAYWQIEISDNGPGIADNVKNHLGDNITAIDRQFKGVASSLLFCVSIMKCLGGELLIQDRIPGDRKQGTRVIIRLPKGE